MKTSILSELFNKHQDFNGTIMNVISEIKIKFLIIHRKKKHFQPDILRYTIKSKHNVYNTNKKDALKIS